MRKIFTEISICIAAAASLFGISSCNKYLDVVPDDGLATLETAFHQRIDALRELGTCYSYMTHEGTFGEDPTLLGGDEIWDLYGRVINNNASRVPSTMFNIARGLMTPENIYANDWVNMYQGIRCCDTYIANVDNVPDMSQQEKLETKSEAMFLKAYFHFNLVRKWGPIPVIRESLPIDANIEQVRVKRDNIDDCFDFILDLLTQAERYMSDVTDPTMDDYPKGRITKYICSAFKARVAVYAASPLFNGNDEEAALVDKDGNRLFPAKDDAKKQERWKTAMEACAAAIQLCEGAGYKLYDTTMVTDNINDTLKFELALRRAFTMNATNELAENPEVIWPNTQSSKSLMTSGFQLWSVISLLNGTNLAGGGYGFIGVPLKIAQQFYTENGLPIAYDNTWVGLQPYDLRTGDDANRFYIQPEYTTINLHFDREPRFYAYVGFDGGKWMSGLSNYNNVEEDQILHVECRMDGIHHKGGNNVGPATGYYPKKLYPYQMTFSSSSIGTYYFPWPMLRVSDLYLLYAEAINEYEGPNGPHSADLFKYLNLVRSRADIPSVEESWTLFSNSPDYYKSKTGMRDIIHKERLNELCFEGQRFWDLRRWKEAHIEYQKNIWGFNLKAREPADFYQPTFIFEQKFGLKDYFWPIATSNIEINPSLVQNLGWN